jgi:hypothetical protein
MTIAAPTTTVLPKILVSRNAHPSLAVTMTGEPDVVDRRR